MTTEMIELRRGDILGADTEALVNTVNCVGVMGRGIALQFRKAFPENFKFYVTACAQRELKPGKLLVFETGSLDGPRFIINFPTKRHWRGSSRIEDIDAGLKALRDEVRKRGIRSIAVPPLGCGLGGLEWDVVRPRIESALSDLSDVKVVLFEPVGAPEPRRMVKDQRTPRMTPGRAVLIELIQRYLTAVLDPFVSLLEIHKLMYLMQAAGEPLNLNFEKGVYGPYAKNLRHVLSLIEGHFISGYGDADDKPSRPIELLPGACDSAAAVISSNPETQQRLDRVGRLIYGFETPYGMELLATAHWVAIREHAGSPNEAVAKTYAWSDRKRIFDTDQIRLAWRILADQGWLATLPASTPDSHIRP